MPFGGLKGIEIKTMEIAVMNCTRILPRMHTGCPVHIWDAPYAYRLPHMRMGQITSSIRIWDAHTCIGSPYVYGQPIRVWDSSPLRVYFSYLGLMDCHPQLAPAAYYLKMARVYI